MAKNRQTKSVIDKYGLSSKLEEARNHVSKIKGGFHSASDFDGIPYIGIAYVDWDDREASEKLVYYVEEFSVDGTSLIKLKVVEVNDKSIVVAQLDDHHHSLKFNEAEHINLEVEGNIIKSK